MCQSGKVCHNLDDYVRRFHTKRTEKFDQLCEFYKFIKGRYPECSFLVYDFIQNTVLPFEPRHFKLLSENRVITVFSKWERITCNVGNNSVGVRWGMLVGYRVAISPVDGTV